MIGLRSGDIHLWRANAIAPGEVAEICSRYLDAPCCILRSALGKPFLAGGALEIGIAHTEGAALLAVARRPIGIDAERMVPLPDLASLVPATLTPAETRELEVPGTDRTARFYRCWVRKEAMLKARGCGLTVDPREVDSTRPPAGWQWIDATLDGAIAVSIATRDRAAKVSFMKLT
jgi:hypothetical protein